MGWRALVLAALLALAAPGRARTDVAWSTVPNALGAGGVSAVYDEKDLGGVTVSARLGVTF